MATNPLSVPHARGEHAFHIALNGKDFGNNVPEKHLRFAYTVSIDRLEQGVERLRRFLV